MRFMAADVARATAGELIGQNAHLSGASFDSRVILPGQLFVPIIADRDGHDYIDGALQAGAGAYLTSRPARGRTAIVVPDTLVALMQLGTWARNKLDSQLENRVIAITGSVGKTSTKDFIAAALGSQFRVTASTRSYNNDQGLPTTILNARDDVECLVLEMGMRGFGEIRRLCDIARPVIGVVTSVVDAHTERVGDIEGVARAKAELPESLDATGTAVLYVDDERVGAMSKLTRASVVTYGESRGADVRIESLHLDDLGRVTARLDTPWGTCEYALGIPGRHMALNAAAAIAVTGVVGADIHLAASALASASMTPMRMQLLTLASGALVLDDSYNANPASMRAALTTLGEIRARRRIAALGLMAELAHPEIEHQRIATMARENSIQVIAVETSLYGVPSRSIDEALVELSDLGEGDVVVVKGSLVAGLERLVERLVN
ncbi:MAG: UDP-N-acetylmuramoyl-tripeptide--D-alanyl-D-alanine ligase [Actinomycetota bacterium]